MQKPSLLRNIPLFSGLSSRELKIIGSYCKTVRYKKGEVIYKEGDAPNGFFCVLSGRVMVYTRDNSGRETALEYLHRGKYFGIISLLTKEPHSVTTRAINDAEILKIGKDDFEFLLKKIPHLALDLSQTLGRRLKNKDFHQKIIFESMVLSVFSSYPRAGRTVYSFNLAGGLRRETGKSVILLEMGLKDKKRSLPAQWGVSKYSILNLNARAFNPHHFKKYLLKNKDGVELLCLAYLPDSESSVQNLLGILSLLVNDYHYIILDLPSHTDNTVVRVLNQSDHIHLISSPDEPDLKKTGKLIRRLKSDFNFAQDKIKVIINEYKESVFAPSQEIKILDHPIFATLPRIEGPVALEYTRAVRRICRQVGECTVGLALGVGGAYGFCHIGVLKVIEEENIPIDIISGSSIGAVMGSLWAIGLSSQEILEVAKEFAKPNFFLSLIDLTFPYLGFIKGRKLSRFLSKYLGDKTFQDVKLPLKIIASDIKKKEAVVIEQGNLLEAVMASSAIPGVFYPFRRLEDFLVNGGIFYPLPTEILSSTGTKKIIAVNVTPSKDDILKESKDFLKAKYKNNNILKLVFGSIEVMQGQIANREEQYADVVLHPDVSGISWTEFNKVEELAKRGEAEARRNLDKIWKLVKD
jgi:NTE family protein